MSLGWKHLGALAVFASMLVLPGARGQSSGCDETNPDIRDATLDVRVTRLAAGFLYEFTIVNPGTSTGCIHGADVETSTRVPVLADGVVIGPQIDRWDDLDPFFTVEGTYSVLQLPLCRGGLGGRGRFGWGCVDEPVLPLGPVEVEFIDGPKVGPGQSLSVFTIESPNPPGRRPYILYPDWDPDAPDTPFQIPPETYLHGFTVGPTNASELSYFAADGGESVAVNDFLTYTNPIADVTRLRRTEVNFPLVVRYGPTIQPSTFSAILNGADISSWFHPVAGGIEAVALQLVPGSDTLVLSIGGFTGGQNSTDNDRLVFLVGDQIPAAAPDALGVPP